MNEQLEQVIREAVSDVDLSPSELPRIDLYLDQILSLISEKNAQGSERYKERVLTKTMINNYSKEGAILPLKGKKYNRQQVLQILFIYSLKSTLSIGEIKRIFDGVNASGDFGADEFESLWEDYLRMKEHSRTETLKISEAVSSSLSLDLEKDEDYFRLMLAIVALSAYLKNVAEAMIDARFPAPAAEENEKPSKADKIAEKAGRVAEKAEKIAGKAERIAEKAEKLAEKEEKKKARKKEKEEMKNLSGDST